MRNFIPAMFAVAAISLPLGAFAEPPAPMGPPPPGMVMGFGVDGANLTQSQRQQFGQIMEQTHQQMDQLQTQLRSKVLGSISPAHRQLLAQVVGNLAISPNPDWEAAARQLDSALSPSEAQTVLAAHQAGMQQMMSIMQSAHQRVQSLLTAQQRQQMTTMHGAGGPQAHAMFVHGGSPGQITAGMILLHLSEAGGGDHVYMMMGGHPRRA